MHMVGHATRPVTFTAGIARDRGLIRMEFWPRADIEQGTTLLRAEYDVNDDEAQGLWHGVDFGPKARFIPGATPQESVSYESMSANGAVHRFRRKRTLDCGMTLMG